MKIIKIKKNGNKYKIILENNKIIDTLGQVIIDNNLLFNMEVNQKLIEKINQDTKYYNAYNKAINQINKRQRSKYEIKQYLIKQDLSNQDIIKIIKTLEKNNLINDEIFTKSYINDKLNLTLDGPNKIKQELEKYHIDIALAQEILSNINIDKRIEKIINKKINKKDSLNIQKKKITTYLVNKGYDINYIMPFINNIKLTNDNFFNQIDKIYNKLSLKYKEDQLLLKLKQKLYQKGYSTEEINKYIEKKQL